MEKEKIVQKLNIFKKYPNAILRNIKSRQPIAWEQVCIPYLAWKDKIDVLHMTSNRSPFLCNCRLLNTVHDVFELKRLEEKYSQKGFRAKFYEWRFREYLIFTYRSIFKRSDAIITVSDKSKKEIAEALKINPKIIYPISHGIDPSFRHLGLKKRYIMTLGGTAFQKNPEGPIESYSLLPESIQKKFPLLIIGTDDVKKTKSIVEKFKIKTVIIKGAVSKKELIRYYNSSKIFLYLSIMEGFGFPPIEAMACGTVPLVYDIEPMNGNVGDKRFCIKLKNNHKVADRIKKIIRNKKEYDQLVSLGINISGEFSWQKCAQEHLKCYERLK